MALHNYFHQGQRSQVSFRVPEELWADEKGHGLRKEDGGDHEILWDAKALSLALIQAAVSKPGQYLLDGDLADIPQLQTAACGDETAATHHQQKRSGLH